MNGKEFLVEVDYGIPVSQFKSLKRDGYSTYSESSHPIYECDRLTGEVRTRYVKSGIGFACGKGSIEIERTISDIHFPKINSGKHSFSVVLFKTEVVDGRSHVRNTNLVIKRMKDDGFLMADIWQLVFWGLHNPLIWTRNEVLVTGSYFIVKCGEDDGDGGVCSFPREPRTFFPVLGNDSYGCRGRSADLWCQPVNEPDCFPGYVDYVLGVKSE